MKDNKKVFSENLKRLMYEKGVNATEVCQVLGFKHNTFSNWITGKIYPRIDKIEIMANYFGVSKSVLVESAPHTCESAPKSDFTADEVKVINNYRKLSKNGKYEVIKRIDELLQLETIGKKGERAI